MSLGDDSIIITNNTDIHITNIGEDADGGLPSLTCHTDLSACCRMADTVDGQPAGGWIYPNGEIVPSSTAGEGFYRIRNAPQIIRLARREGANPLSPTGSYCCSIPTVGGEMTLCANLSECFVVSFMTAHEMQPCCHVSMTMHYTVVCPSLTLPNGMISYSDPTLGEGSVANHICDPGFALATSVRSRMCRANGVWSGSNLLCTGVCSLLIKW